jgi:hypothetical protein
MPRGRRWAVLLFFASTLLGCGARTSLDESSDASSGGAGGSSDGGVVRTCPAWVKTRDAVQVSDVPSIIEAQALIATPAGALVGYADAQFPPVDASWHARSVSFVDGSLGVDHAVLHRDTSGLGWTRVSLAATGGRAAATASDDTKGAQFVEIDASGAPIAPPVIVPGDPARFMLPTPNGYSVLRSKFDPSGGNAPPVGFSSLDAHGALGATSVLIDQSTSVVTYSRVALADDSFVLAWTSSAKACSGCRKLFSRHFDASGQPLSNVAMLHTFGATDYGSSVIAVSTSAMLVARTDQKKDSAVLLAQPFDADGHPLGGERAFASSTQGNAPMLALAPAPGGDFLVAWADGDFTGTGQVHVESLRADGSAEGQATVIAEASLSTDSDIFVVVSGRRAMVLYAADIQGFGIEAFAVPLRCVE